MADNDLTIDHVDTCVHNHTINNLVTMPSKWNSAKKDVFSLFPIPAVITSAYCYGKYRVLVGAQSVTNMIAFTGHIKKESRDVKLFICNSQEDFIALAKCIRRGVSLVSGISSQELGLMQQKREEFSITDSPQLAIAFQQKLAAVPEECFTQVTPELLKNGVELII